MVQLLERREDAILFEGAQFGIDDIGDGNGFAGEPDAPVIEGAAAGLEAANEEWLAGLDVAMLDEICDGDREEHDAAIGKGEEEGAAEFFAAAGGIGQRNLDGDVGAEAEDGGHGGLYN
jgi:hypothetical protein